MASPGGQQGSSLTPRSRLEIKITVFVAALAVLGGVVQAENLGDVLKWFVAAIAAGCAAIVATRGLTQRRSWGWFGLGATAVALLVGLVALGQRDGGDTATAGSSSDRRGSQTLTVGESFSEGPLKATVTRASPSFRVVVILLELENLSSAPLPVEYQIAGPSSAGTFHVADAAGESYPVGGVDDDGQGRNVQFGCEARRVTLQPRETHSIRLSCKENRDVYAGVAFKKEGLPAGMAEVTLTLTGLFPRTDPGWRVAVT